MNNYIVSARKYRPSTFNSVVGQRALTTTLKNAIASNRLAHAYLFCGPRGVGKTTCARIFAKTINCLSPNSEGEACNQCESCMAFNEQRSYNIHELDAASNNGVDDMKSLVEQVRIPPQIGKYKVFIIDEVHMLSNSAFNAFLKTLEEPPHHAIFILATTEKHKILPTILSRCQIYDFNRISVEDTIEHLAYVAKTEGVNVESDALNVIALKADGGMRDALSIFDQIVSFTNGNITYKGVIDNLNVLDYEYYFRLTDCLVANRISESLLLFNDILSNGFEGSHFITGLASHFRDLLVSKDVSTVGLLQVGANIRERYIEQAQKCVLPFLYSAIKLCNDCDINYRASKNKRLLVELTLIQVAQLTQENSDVSGGRGPTKILKPIFKQLENAQQSQAVSVAHTQQSKNDNAADSHVSVSADALSAYNKKSNENSSNVGNNASTKVVAKKLSSIGGVSLKSNNKQQDSTTHLSSNIVKDENQGEAVFDENSLNFYWKSYANQLPKEQDPLAKSMQNIRPVLLDDNTTFEITVENDMVAKDFKDLTSVLLNYLRTALKNRNITMSIVVNQNKDGVRPISRIDKFKVLVDKNSVLLQLKEEFKLDFY